MIELVNQPPVNTRQCGKSVEDVPKPDSAIVKKTCRKTCDSMLAQKHAVSEVHPTQRSHRQKGPPGSDAWVSKRRILGPQ